MAQEVRRSLTEELTKEEELAKEEEPDALPQDTLPDDGINVDFTAVVKIRYRGVRKTDSSLHYEVLYQRNKGETPRTRNISTQDASCIFEKFIDWRVWVKNTAINQLNMTSKEMLLELEQQELCVDDFVMIPDHVRSGFFPQDDDTYFFSLQYKRYPRDKSFPPKYEVFIVQVGKKGSSNRYWLPVARQYLRCNLALVFPRETVKKAMKNPDKKFPPVPGCSGRSSIAQLEALLPEGAKTEVDVMYTKRANTTTCMVCASASVIHHYGSLTSTASWVRAAVEIYRKGIVLPCDNMLTDSVNHLIQTSFRGQNVRKFRILRHKKGNFYRPLEDTDGKTSEFPIVAKLKGRNKSLSHCVGFCNGLIFDPEYPYALRISRATLDALCGGQGQYLGLYWSKKFVTVSA